MAFDKYFDPVFDVPLAQQEHMINQNLSHAQVVRALWSMKPRYGVSSWYGCYGNHHYNNYYWRTMVRIGLCEEVVYLTKKS